MNRYLEIKQNAIGNVGEPGEKLMMRLYKSGRFEYDANPKANITTDSHGNVLYERKQGHINSEGANELLDLAERSDFQTAKDFYPTIHLHTDETYTTTVTYTNNALTKKIVISDFWDVASHPEDKARYPNSLVELLYKESSLKAKVVNEL